MTLQFINMEVMKLIICSKSWKHQILINSFIFGIALRNKHFKVNIFSESSLCGLHTNILCPSNKNKYFFLSLLNIFISFFSRAVFFGVFFGCWLGVSCFSFFGEVFIPCLFSSNFHLLTHMGMCAHAHTQFSFKHSETLTKYWLLNWAMQWCCK